MKNIGRIAILSVAILFFGFLFGFLFGKLCPTSFVTLSAYDRSSIETPDDTRASNSYGKININTASADLLATLPGIGKTISQRIIEYREENGAFIRIEDLSLVKGISDELVEKIAEYITVGG